MKSLARYAATNALTRTMLGELLKPKDYEALARAESLEGAWLALRKTPYEQWLPEEAPTEVLAIERATAEATALRFRRSVRSLKGKPREVGNLLLSRWELDNLEFTLRLWHARDISLSKFVSPLTLVNRIPLYDILEAESIEGVALALKDTPYFGPVSSSIAAYKRRKAIFFVEMELERDYYKRLLEATAALSGTDAKRAAKIVGAEIDIVNIVMLTRLVDYYEFKPEDFGAYAIPGPSEISRRLSTGVLSEKDIEDARTKVLSQYLPEASSAQLRDSISLLERVVREMAVDVARSALMGYPFSITCVFAFYLLKRNELENLRTIFGGKAIGVDEEEIMKHLYGLG